MKIKILLVISSILLLNCLLIETEGTQNYIIVPDNYSNVQDAIDNAQENDIIIIRNGIFYENLYINKPLSLIGTDKDNR
jgi:pectin methylesterase-like acyl-CoA thioesterase